MSWNYRLTKETLKGETVFAIREVYYNAAGEVDGWTENPVYPSGETWEEFTKSFALYEKAICRKSQVIDVTEADEKGGTTTEGKEE